MADFVEMLCQQIRTKDGNDCLINDAYFILKWQGIYMYMHIRKYCGGWVDNKINYEEAREFDNEEQAREYMKLRIAEDY